MTSVARDVTAAMLVAAVSLSSESPGIDWNPAIMENLRYFGVLQYKALSLFNFKRKLKAFYFNSFEYTYILPLNYILKLNYIQITDSTLYYTLYIFIIFWLKRSVMLLFIRHLTSLTVL